MNRKRIVNRAIRDIVIDALFLLVVCSFIAIGIKNRALPLIIVAIMGIFVFTIYLVFLVEKIVRIKLLFSEEPIIVKAYDEKNIIDGLLERKRDFDVTMRIVIRLIFITVPFAIAVLILVGVFFDLAVLAFVISGWLLAIIAIILFCYYFTKNKNLAMDQDYVKEKATIIVNKKIAFVKGSVFIWDYFGIKLQSSYEKKTLNCRVLFLGLPLAKFSIDDVTKNEYAIISEIGKKNDK